MGDSIPDERVKDTAEEFENQSQTNANMASDSAYNWQTNRKRTYDAYQQFDIEGFRRKGALDEKLDNIAVQALQNAVETANMVSKQTLRNDQELAYQYRRHSDLAADSYWNPVSAGAGMNLTAGSVPSNRTIDQETAVAGGAVANASAAVASAVAKQVDATITPILATLQQMIQALATATTSIANVVNQSQPKTPAA